MKNVILFGNGFNLLSDNCPSWNKLLSEISDRDKALMLEGIPPTLQYEQVYISPIDVLHNNKREAQNEETNLKLTVRQRLSSINTNEYYDLLKKLDVDIFLTTNYDHAFFNNDINLLIDYENSEKLYSVRRWNKLHIEERDIWLYPIHGDISAVKSIMLGLDHYGGSLAKVQDYVKGNYQRRGKYLKIPSIEKRIENNIETVTAYGFKDSGSGLMSWVDSFFFTNLHIIGLALDFSEIDIWWLITRYARLRKLGLLNNSICYYPTFPACEEKKHISKLTLLEKLGVKVEYHKIKDDTTNEAIGDKSIYKAIYKEQINNIKKNL